MKSIKQLLMTKQWAIVYGVSAVIGVLAVALLTAWDSWTPVKADQNFVADNRLETNGTCEQFKFAVVKCGVHDAWDFDHARLDDAVVAADYKGLEYLSVGHLKTSASWYMQYRRGDKLYWTGYKVRLNTGESVVATEGFNATYYIRSRCGNRMSVVPQQPVEREHDQPTYLDLATLDNSPNSGNSRVPESTNQLNAPELLAAPIDVTPLIPMKIQRYMSPKAELLNPGTLQVLAGGLVPLESEHPDHHHVAVTPEPGTGWLVFGCGVLLAFFGVKKSRHLTQALKTTK